MPIKTTRSVPTVASPTSLETLFRSRHGLPCPFSTTYSFARDNSGSSVGRTKFEACPSELRLPTDVTRSMSPLGGGTLEFPARLRSPRSHAALMKGQILAAASMTSMSSLQVMSLMAGREFAARITSAPPRNSSRASGITPSTTSAPALSTNIIARRYGATQSSPSVHFDSQTS